MLVRERVEILLTLAEGQTLAEMLEAEEGGKELPAAYHTALKMAKSYVGGTNKETHKVRALAWKTAAKHLSDAGHAGSDEHKYASEMGKGHKEADKSYRIRKSGPETDNEPKSEPSEADKKRERIRHQVKMVRAAAADRPFRDALAKAKARKEAFLAKRAAKKKEVNPEAQARVKAALEKGAKLTPPSEIKKGPAISPASREKEADKRKEAPDTSESNVGDLDADFKNVRGIDKNILRTKHP